MRETVELRVRRRQGSFRMQIGVARSRAELAELLERQKVLKRLADRGEWDVLGAIRGRRVSAAEVVRLVDQHGIDNYRAHARFILAPPVPDAPTLDAHVAVWLETVERESTRATYAKAMPKLTEYVVDGERLGDRPWHRVARHTIKDLKASLHWSPNTIRLYMGAWSSFFSWAIEREQSLAEEQGRAPLIVENPVQRAKAWSAVETTRHRFLTRAEFQKVLEVSAKPMRAQYATLALAGLRVDEFAKLPPAHVHLPTHIHIGPWGEWAPKGYPRHKHGVRDIPIHRAILLPLLEEYAAEVMDPSGPTFFVNPNTGAGWTHVAFRDRLKKDLRAAGLVSGQWSRATGDLVRKATGITAHTFRHTLASWLAQEDVQLMKIAALLGDTEATVKMHYAHLLPGDLDQSLNRLALADELDERHGGTE